MTATSEVSGGNPCPFLRALVASGHIDGHIEALGTVSDLVAAAGGVPTPAAHGVRAATYLIGLVGNGLGPTRLAQCVRTGMNPDQLRDGPLDKHGAGSRILDPQGRVDPVQLDRLDHFAVDRIVEGGRVERVLGAEQLTAMMDTNFARAEGARRAIDRRLMEGEWPVLLRIIGTRDPSGDYLTVAEVRALFVELELPPAVVARLEAWKGADPAWVQ